MSKFGTQFNFDFPKEKEKKTTTKKKIKVIKNVTASITKVTPLGDVIIEFNSSILLKKEEISLDLVLEPAQGRKSEGLKFNWTIVSNTSDTISIKLEFENPLDVSALFEQDVLKVTFKNRFEIFAPA